MSICQNVKMNVPVKNPFVNRNTPKILIELASIQNYRIIDLFCNIIVFQLANNH